MTTSPKSSPRTDARRVCSVIMFAAAFVISLFVEFWILRSRQQFTIIFNDFDSELPALFELVTSNWFAAIVPVLAVLSVAKEILVRNANSP